MSPKKVGGRQKVSAHVRVQHSASSIEDITEDTPTLVALQAVEDEMEQEKSPPAKKLKVSKVTWDKIENEVDKEEMEKYPQAKKSKVSKYNKSTYDRIKFKRAKEDGVKGPGLEDEIDISNNEISFEEQRKRKEHEISRVLTRKMSRDAKLPQLGDFPQQTTASKQRGRKPKSKAEGEKAVTDDEKVTIKKEVGVEEVENVKLRLRRENFKLIKKVKELEEKCVGKDKLIEIRDMELKLKEQEIKELNKEKARLSLLVDVEVITVE